MVDQQFRFPRTAKCTTSNRELFATGASFRPSRPFQNARSAPKSHRISGSFSEKSMFPGFSGRASTSDLNSPASLAIPNASEWKKTGIPKPHIRVDPLLTHPSCRLAGVDRGERPVKSRFLHPTPPPPKPAGARAEPTARLHGRAVEIQSPPTLVKVCVSGSVNHCRMSVIQASLDCFVRNHRSDRASARDSTHDMRECRENYSAKLRRF